MAVLESQSLFDTQFELEEREDRWVVRCKPFPFFVYGATKAEAKVNAMDALMALAQSAKDDIKREESGANR